MQLPDGAAARGLPPHQSQHGGARPGRPPPGRLRGEPPGPRHLRGRAARRRTRGAPRAASSASSRTPSTARGGSGSPRMSCSPRWPPAPRRGGRGSRPRARALLIECNQAELTRYRDQLEAELPLHVERMLVEEFEARAPREPGLFEGYRVVITTFFHIHEVKRAMPAGRPSDGGVARRRRASPRCCASPSCPRARPWASSATAPRAARIFCARSSRRA